jgi:TatD family-associated radical SAM protein
MAKIKTMEYTGDDIFDRLSFGTEETEPKINFASIAYTLKDSIYINLTNECPCRCEFCIRTHHNGVGSADNLWLEKTPGKDEVIASINKVSAENPAIKTAVFCGYGEPFCELETMLAAAGYLKEKGFTVRVNTNGLGDLIQGCPTAIKLKGLIDIVSISLNAPNAELYNKICKPKYGLEAYPALLKFAEDCKIYVPEVRFTAMDTLSEEDIKQCVEIAAKAGIPLRIREFE